MVKRTTHFLPDKFHYILMIVSRWVSFPMTMLERMTDVKIRHRPLGTGFSTPRRKCLVSTRLNLYKFQWKRWVTKVCATWYFPSYKVAFLPWQLLKLNLDFVQIFAVLYFLLWFTGQWLCWAMVKKDPWISLGINIVSTYLPTYLP